MSQQNHPSELLKPEWVKIIRGEAMAAEQAGLLQAGQLELIYQQQWFKILVPKIYGGLELPLPEVVRLEEAFAWADGSLGWVITLCAGAGWFGGFLQPKVAEQIFADPKACLAGSGASTGTALKTADGYQLSGSWKYASGIKHATHFTANCIIRQGEETLPDADGNPLIIPFVIDRADAELIPAWKYVGMMGTGSHAFKMNEVKVPASRSFKIEAESAVVKNPLYTYPFLQLAETTLAANLSGMALHFIDLCEPIFEERIQIKKLTAYQHSVLKEALQEEKENLRNLRRFFYEALDQSWNSFTSGKHTEAELKTVSQTSRVLALASRESVDRLYPYCGLIAASPDTEINQVWRDIHTASQHTLLTFLE
ncbi:acyl-CoA dehydrogenase [Mucilaginibacter sp. RS28]|uniref:Acyl-CoA dehydrogenase n=1 Tax=Mucilaginibacter straminoryzae TaxID=2932774 RepID=A0A9X1X8Z2_9SPHI|nr:acyl-CoA dehydrogenase [Mucilaginibacter straminoryzae]MCJ8210589.1 acyl-CoA dehydrogenase [Mucilaginibacter straminoryzae]